MQKTVCAHIKKLRGSSSYIEFGKKLNLSAASIERWEKGRSDIKSDAIVKICSTCGVSADWLLGLSDRTEFPSSVFSGCTIREESEPYIVACQECVKKDAVIAEQRATIIEAMTGKPSL